MSEAEHFYDHFAPEEWKRLERHRTEFAVTLKAFDEFLPSPPCTILDIGGGPGRYSIELARQGYSVTLLDISRESLRLAREKTGEAQVSLTGFSHSNAVDLSELDSASFEAVLLMGPLYHLLSREERVQAIREAMRVLIPSGRLFATFITRFAPFRYAARDDPAWFVENREYALRVLETGVHDQSKKFAQTHFARPEEVVPLMEICGAKSLALIGCEGIVSGHEDSKSTATIFNTGGVGTCTCLANIV